ncbi:hypothetical protein [Synechococcus sp. CCY9202]|uniref:tetratricopeptide repeat protein n=1 Tax=Synechococcus sp. CCY9202 TaxID=174698 RepID=UPI002B20EA71|nr:hypothetical protein [Synechococcus sp. CCY9202]MEA5424260.1 hypothetical protein [Synechococcus sp. CCY9202]
MTTPAQQPGRLRRALGRLWPRPQAEAPALAQSPLFEGVAGNRSPAVPVSVPLPAHAPEHLVAQASRYFDYAEDLSLRGAPELAAPFFRQAYVLLRASAQSGPYSSDGPVVAPRPVQTIAAQPQPANTTNPAQQTPAVPWRQRLETLRRQLNAQTAAAVTRELDQLQAQGVSDPDLHKLKGLAALLQRDEGKAEEGFRAALELDSSHYSSLVNLAGILVRSGRAEQAIPLLRRSFGQIAADDPEAVPALNNLALAHQQLGQAMEAAQLVHRIHRLKPGYLRPARLTEAAGTLEQMGQDREAIELLTWLQQQQQASPALLRTLAQLHERRGEFEQASLIYRQALADPDDIPSVAKTPFKPDDPQQGDARRGESLKPELRNPRPSDQSGV